MRSHNQNGQEKMYKVVFLFFVVANSIAWSDVIEEANIAKEKKEIIELKKELTQFYDTKEAEYQKNKKELEDLLATIESKRSETKKLHEETQQMIQDIEGKVASKTAKIYNSMKPKIAAEIFDKMIKDGKIKDVFDIIIKLNEKNVTLIFRYLSVENASDLTEMLKNYKISQNEIGE